ncbi:MAG: acyltransferase family protein [Actinoplanes sp.]
MTVTQDRTANATATPRPRGGSRIAVLDGLRLVAALMVVLYHFTGFDPGVTPAWGVKPATGFPDLHHFTQYGYMGVELFFMISGFVICMSSWGRTVGGFFRSRVVRLFPAYWPAVLLTTAVVAIWPTVREPHRFNEVLLNLTMLNAPVGVAPVDGVYWSLWAEARFYLLFAVSLLLWRGGITLRNTTIFAYVWLIAGVLSQNANEPLLKIVFQPEYAPLFVAGIAYYLIHRFGSDIKLWGLVGVSFLLAAHNAIVRLEAVGPRNLGRELSPTVGFLLIAVYFGLMAVIAMGWTSRIQWRWLTTAGLLTYPLYLLHEHIGWTIIHGLQDLRPRWLTLALVLLIMLTASWLLHKLIEKPLARWLKVKLEAASTAGRAATETAKAPTPAVRLPEQRPATEPRFPADVARTAEPQRAAEPHPVAAQQPYPADQPPYAPDEHPYAPTQQTQAGPQTFASGTYGSEQPHYAPTQPNHAANHQQPPRPVEPWADTHRN